MLDIRVFDEVTKQSVYRQQTTDAQTSGFRIVHFVLLDTIAIKVEYTKFQKCMQTMLQFGQKVVVYRKKTVKCYVKLTTEQKEINNFVRKF